MLISPAFRQTLIRTFHKYTFFLNLLKTDKYVFLMRLLDFLPIGHIPISLKKTPYALNNLCLSKFFLTN